jgi:hypothetical protein
VNRALIISPPNRLCAQKHGVRGETRSSQSGNVEVKYASDVWMH